MTYCVGIALEQGLVMASDSRTNAGVDYVTTYSKMHVFNPAPDRVFVILSAGNLATTQEAMNHIRRDLDFPTGAPNLANVHYLFEAAEYVGGVSLAVQRAHSQALSQIGVSGETSLILGGQIQGQSPGLLMIYPQGNCIAASADTPYLQIGESKYGKPALDRLAHPGLSLEDGARLCLVSLEATSRSNVSVGPPFEIILYPCDGLGIAHHLRYQADDPYLQQVQNGWNDGLCRAFNQLPRLPWEETASG